MTKTTSPQTRVNLKEARRIEQELGRLISVDIDTTAQFNALDTNSLDSIDEFLNKTSLKVDQKLDQLIKIIDLRYDIRHDIAEENNRDRSGGSISLLMNTKVKLETRKNVYERLIRRSENSVSMTADAIHTRLNVMKTNHDEYSGIRGYMLNAESMAPITLTDLVVKVSVLKRTIRGLENSLLQLNMSSTIGLDEESVLLLSELDII